MADITRIDVRIVTGERDGAKTDGKVYLGILGRELLLDSTGNDFEKGQDQTFVLGDRSNSYYPDQSDPRKPRQLDTEDLDRFPMWIRFEPENNHDNWNVEFAEVTVNPGSNPQRYENGRGGGHLWLGKARGWTWFHLKKAQA